MPLSQIDNHPALIVIDLQKGITGHLSEDQARPVIQHAAQLAEAFRQKSWPVVLVNVAGMANGRTDAGMPTMSFPNDWSELIPELNAQESDFELTKYRWGAFTGSNLDEYLKVKNVTQIFLAGVSTSVGVETTARSAYELGYNVVLVEDAMTDSNPEAHQYAVNRIFPKLGEVTTTSECLQKL